MNLIGTTWTFNSDANMASGVRGTNAPLTKINSFTSNGTTYSMISYEIGKSDDYVLYGTTRVCYGYNASWNWYDDSFKTITINSIASGSESALETWLESNATQVIAIVDYVTTNQELESVADAIRSKGGTSSPLVYPTGFVSAINAIPTGGGGGIKYAKYYTNDGETFNLDEGVHLSVEELAYDCEFIGFCTDPNSGDIISIAGSQHSDYQDTLIFSNINQQDSTPIPISSFSDGEIMIEYYGSALQGYLYAFVEGTGVDLSNDTVESSVLLEGYTAHDKNGTSITGSLAIATMAEVEAYFGLT